MDMASYVKPSLYGLNIAHTVLNIIHSINHMSSIGPFFW